MTLHVKMHSCEIHKCPECRPTSFNRENPATLAGHATKMLLN